jgi:spore coat protein U-like protein
MRNLAIAATALLASLVAGPALAQSAPDDMGVTLTVEASCTISVGTLDFGNIATLTTGAGDINASTDISVTCTSEAPYQIGLGLGLNALTTQRRLFNSAATANTHLNYGLFRNNARDLAWGATKGTDTASGTGNGTAQTHTVYGSVPSGQNVSLGDYADTVTATVWYGTGLP